MWDDDKCECVRMFQESKGCGCKQEKANVYNLNNQLNEAKKDKSLKMTY